MVIHFTRGEIVPEIIAIKIILLLQTEDFIIKVLVEKEREKRKQ